MHAQRGFASRSTLLVIAAAFAAGLGLYAAQRWLGVAPPQRAPATAPRPALNAVRLFDAPRSLPPFSLDLAGGGTATPTSLAGHWTLVFLGFTHCPDVCPTTLAELAKAQAQWRALPAPTRPRLLFLTVDPERDTPALVGDYARFFSPDTLAASATPDQLARAAAALGLVYMMVPTAGGDYTMDHSATLVLLDPQGREAGVVRPPLDWKPIADDLATLSTSRP
jgi:protein SCO1/2